MDRSLIFVKACKSEVNSPELKNANPNIRELTSDSAGNVPALAMHMAMNDEVYFPKYDRADGLFCTAFCPVYF